MEDMRDKVKNLLKDTIVFAFGTLGSKAILFLLVPLYTNYLSAEQYGTAELVITIGQLIVPIITLSIWEAVLRIGLSNGQKKADVLCNGFIILEIGIILMIFITPMLEFYQPIREWKWYLCWYSILYCLVQVELNYLKVVGKNKLFAGLSLLQTVVLAALNFIFMIKMNLGIKGYLLSIIISSMISASLIFILGKYAEELRNAKSNRKLRSEMIRYSAPLIVTNISWWLIHSSDKIMIESMLTGVELGIYTVAAKIPGLINVITSVFSQAWGISSIKEIETTNDNIFYTRIFETYSMSVFGIVIVFSALIKPFMRLYVGVEFMDAWCYVPILLVAAAFAAFSSFMGSLLCALKKSSHCMWSTMAGAVINIGLNYIFIKRIGLWGALVGTLCAQIGIAVIRVIDIIGNMKLKIDWNKFLLDAIVVIIQAVLVSCSFHIYLISGACLGIFIVNHCKEILFLLKQMKRYMKRR